MICFVFPFPWINITFFQVLLSLLDVYLFCKFNHTNLIHIQVLTYLCLSLLDFLVGISWMRCLLSLYGAGHLLYIPSKVSCCPYDVQRDFF